MTSSSDRERAGCRWGGIGVHRILRAALTVVVCVTISSAGDVHAGLDGYNKAMLGFNRWLLRRVLEPVSRGYNLVVPKWGQRRFTAFFANLEGPRDIINSGLQLKFHRAGTHTGRFLINSTLGLAGFFDVGRDWFKWEAVPETFDETLGRYGVPLGPYIIVPLIGDSSPRHLPGYIVDRLLDPVFWVTPFYVSTGEVVLNGANLLASQMPSPWASGAEWDAYRRSRFDFPPYEIGRETFVADEADRVAE